MLTYKEQKVTTENYEISKKIYYLFKKYENFSFNENKYDYSNLFKNRKYTKENPSSRTLSIVQYKDSILKRILNRIKRIFSKNN